MFLFLDWHHRLSGCDIFFFFLFSAVKCFSAGQFHVRLHSYGSFFALYFPWLLEKFISTWYLVHPRVTCNKLELLCFVIVYVFWVFSTESCDHTYFIRATHAAHHLNFCKDLHGWRQQVIVCIVCFTNLCGITTSLLSASRLILPALAGCGHF